MVSTSKVFGTVWSDNRTGTDQVYYEAMSAAGAGYGPPTAIYTASTPKSQGDAHLAWGSTKFGVVWQDSDKNGIAFESFATDGFSKSAVVTVGAGGYSPDIAWDSTSQQFIVVWLSGNGTLYARSVAQDGTLGAAPVTVQGAYAANAALDSSGGALGAVWEESSDNTYKSSWARLGTLSGAPALQGAVNVTNNTPTDGTYASSPKVAGIATGFALTWHPNTSSLDTGNAYEELKADRSVACGPITLDGEYIVPAIAASPGGAVVVAPFKAASNFDLVLDRIATGCKKVGTHVPIASGVNLATAVAFGDANGFAVLWQKHNTSNNHYEIWRRTFGPLFCN